MDAPMLTSPAAAQVLDVTCLIMRPSESIVDGEQASFAGPTSCPERPRRPIQVGFWNLPSASASLERAIAGFTGHAAVVDLTGREAIPSILSRAALEDAAVTRLGVVSVFTSIHDS